MINQINTSALNTDTPISTTSFIPDSQNFVISPIAEDLRKTIFTIQYNRFKESEKLKTEQMNSEFLRIARTELRTRGGLSERFVIRYSQYVRSTSHHPLQAFGGDWTLDNIEAGDFSAKEDAPRPYKYDSADLENLNDPSDCRLPDDPADKAF